MSKTDRNTVLMELQFAEMLVTASKRPNPKLSADQRQRIQLAAQQHYDKAVALAAQCPLEAA